MTRAPDDQEPLLRGLLESLATGVLVEDERRTVVAINRRLCEIIGIAWDAADLSGIPAERIEAALAERCLDPSRVRALLSRTDAREGAAEEVRLADGTVLALRSFPLTIDERPRRVWLIDDVTERSRAQQEAAHSREQTMRIYERMTDAFFTLDREWRFTYLSPQAEQDPETGSVIGRNIWETFPDLADTAFFTEYHRAMRDGEPVRLSTSFRGRWYEATAYPSDEGLSVFYRDVTRERHAQEALARSEERFRISFEQAAIGMAVIDLEARFLSVNQALCDLLRYDRDELLAKSFGELEHPDDIRASLRHYRDMVEGRTSSMQVEKRLIRKDGVVLWVLATGSLVHDADGAPCQFVAQIQDITTQRQALESLRASEQRHAEAYEREREAAQRLRALDEMKNAFLSAVSHDLRTPLTSILGFAETLELRGHLLDAGTREAVVRGLASNARRLARILTDLLDLDRLQRGILVPNRRRTDVATVVAEALRTADLSGEHPVEMDLDPVVADVDPAQVERIVENLVANAVRHTPASTRIWVTLRDEGDAVMLAVEDAGPGIAADQRMAIFEAFRQGPGASTHAPGVGIGLSLVARFAALHGGGAWVEDRPGGGASFRVRLPKRAPEPYASTA